ncbi:AAA family ATPase [Flavobacteriaceae bacterium F89]|uniref:AAA family ATPase n=1 Tax=Cerina litoralis TaxID=2874477 RepID=A0AAE3EYY1_9FLAO|nr:AAA family ATPase [Cerina litoralis]MCG2462292.1 AAA family ATPase [Cerina litoralis]
MNQKEIQKGIELLCDTSTVVKNYYKNDQNILEALNNVNKGNLQKCAEYYKNKSGVVVDIRKEIVAKLLANETLTEASLNELIEDHKKGKENKFRTYKETFSIVFPVITFYGHNSQRDFVKTFTKKLMGDLGFSSEVKVVSFDFQGERQQGSERYWVAIYNKHQENQSVGIQFFFEFYNGKISYGVHKHKDQTYLKPIVSVGPEQFSYSEMLSYFEKSKQLLLNDVPKFDNLSSISLNQHKLYKISHGSFKSKKDVPIIETFKSNNWIVLHESTGKGQSDAFKDSLKVGDYVYITVGSKELIGIAKLTSNEWDYVPNDIVDSDGWIYKEVELINPSLRKKPKDLTNKKSFYPSANTTFSEILPENLSEANELLFKPYFNVEFIKDKNTNDNSSLTSHELNQILYGPPGTGKTYDTINRALELCGEDLTGLCRADIKARFEQKVDEGRVVFTTFHQSMTYEDFIEGIKPIEPEKEGDPVIYRVEEGIFRRLCIEASFSLAKEKESVATENVLDFSLVYDNFVEEIEEKLAVEEPIILATKNGGKVIIDGISQQRNIIIKHPGKDNTYTVSKKRLSKLHTAFPNLAEMNNIDQQFRSIIGGSNSTANWSVLNAIRSNNPVSMETKKAVREYSWEDKKEVVQALKKEDYKGKIGEPFVLIVDEINRGNVSQIFGELITLIEEDKRLGKAEAIQVRLPYSKDLFGVPPNVHIIGTMNTADRSIEALDTALRRRFSFTEMPSKPELIKTDGKAENGIINGIDLTLLLVAINKRIEKLLDSDHVIGHSYFLTVKSLEGLKAIFQNKIIPLLLEYFFGDYGKIGLVIGSGFFVIGENQVEEDFFAPFDDYDSSPFIERKVYHLRNALEMSDETFIQALNTLERKTS